MLMAQAIRPPASPVGSVLSDTHSMNPGNGASSSILPGSEEGIGGRHGCPHTLAATVIYNEWIENTADLDAGRHRFAPRRRAGDGAAKDGGAFAGAPTAITSAAAWRIQPFGTQEGKPIPLGWALDREGHPTTDPKAGFKGPMLPAGAQRGDAALTSARTCFRPCCRTKMSACQGYRRRDLAHRPGRKD
jgi:hypothetical protein